ncbi:MAG: hypothetical protein IPM56_02080 [Ignavibacteriales bacterium]|nr:MAG: hypothetical protein IPM56_02080 [Ignavibacteriales bacterium]
MLEHEKIKQNLRDKSDEEIYIIARNESKELRDDVRPILIEEIKRRKLNLKLITWIDLENRELPIDQIKKRISSLNCPSCGSKQTRIIGIKNSFIICFLRFTNNHTSIKFLCERCARKNVIKYSLITFFLGWWGIGIIIAPFILFNNVLNFLKIDRNSEEILEHVIETKRGLIAKDINNDISLLKFIKQFNRNNSL